MKFMENTIENWRVEMTARKNLPGRCAITITISNNDEATQSHTTEIHNFRFDHRDKWIMLNQEFVLENEVHKIIWDFETQTTRPS